jgi:hypothetical protein
MDVLIRSHPLLVEEAAHVGGLPFPVVLPSSLPGRPQRLMVVPVRQLELRLGLLRAGPHREEQVEEPAGGLLVLLVLEESSEGCARSIRRLYGYVRVFHQPQTCQYHLYLLARHHRYTV